MAAIEEEQADLYLAPLPEQPRAGEPIARIVDPSVAEDEDELDEPLFTEPAYEQRRKGGFLSLFGGRPRYETPAPAPRAMTTRGGAMPAEAAEPEAHAEPGEDLEIPSFLRRLAN